MNRNLYQFGSVLLVLSFLATLFQSFLYFQIEGRVYFLDSFVGWFVVATVVYFAALFILLKYFHEKQFVFAFWTLMILTIISLVHYIIVYGFVTGKPMGGYYQLTGIVLLGASLFSGISLIFSEARKRHWLRIAGIFELVMVLVLITVILLSLNSQDIDFKVAMTKIYLVTSTVGALVLIVLMINYSSEIKALKLARPDVRQKKFTESPLAFVVFIAFVVLLFLGSLVGKETYMAKYWDGKNAEKTNEFAQQCEARTYINEKGDTLKYLLMVPQNYDPQKKYPLVVSLPYGGYASPAGQWLAEDNNRRKYPAFLFTPYCKEGRGWGGVPNSPAIDTLVFDAIDALEKEVAIDPKRIYVSGVSRGGYGSWHFICARPDMFAAAVPVCGGGDPTLASNLVDVSVWAFHGEKDRNVPVKGSRDMIDAIKKAGGDPKYTEFSGAGHNIWHEVTTTPGLLDWLFAQAQE